MSDGEVEATEVLASEMMSASVCFRVKKAVDRSTGTKKVSVPLFTRTFISKLLKRRMENVKEEDGKGEG